MSTFLQSAVFLLNLQIMLTLKPFSQRSASMCATFTEWGMSVRNTVEVLSTGRRYVLPMGVKETREFSMIGDCGVFPHVSLLSPHGY